MVSKAEVLAGAGPMLDARGKPRFEGSEPDPRPGVAAGHIPGARNLPFAALYNEDGTFRSKAELQGCSKGGRRPSAVRRQLWLGRDRQFADLRGASARPR